MKNSKNPVKKQNKFRLRLSWNDFILYGFLFLFFLFLTVGVGDLGHTNDAKSIPVSRFIQDVKNGKVKSTEVSGDTLNITYKMGITPKPERKVIQM